MTEDTKAALVKDFWRCPECDERRESMLKLWDGEEGGPATVANLTEDDLGMTDWWVECANCNYVYQMGSGEVCDSCTHNCIVVDGVGSCMTESPFKECDVCDKATAITWMGLCATCRDAKKIEQVPVDAEAYHDLATYIIGEPD